MLTHPIDFSKLMNDIQALIADCIHLKALLRTRWTRPMAEEQRRHLRVRRKLTELLILLTASRNRPAAPKPRLHVVHPPRHVRDTAGPDFDPKTWDAIGYNMTIATRLLPEYAVTVTMMSAVQARSAS